jgi:hypothetical protein
VDAEAKAAPVQCPIQVAAVTPDTLAGSSTGQ